MLIDSAVKDASPSRERLGRVVELLRGAEEDRTLSQVGQRRARPPQRRPRATLRPIEPRWNAGR